MGSEQAAHATEGQHQGLIPLLLLTIAAVVHQHLHTHAPQPPQHLPLCLHHKCSLKQQHKAVLAITAMSVQSECVIVCMGLIHGHHSSTKMMRQHPACIAVKRHRQLPEHLRDGTRHTC